MYKIYNKTQNTVEDITFKTPRAALRWAWQNKEYFNDESIAIFNNSNKETIFEIEDFGSNSGGWRAVSKRLAAALRKRRAQEQQRREWFKNYNNRQWVNFKNVVYAALKKGASANCQTIGLDNNTVRALWRKLRREDSALPRARKIVSAIVDFYN